MSVLPAVRSSSEIYGKLVSVGSFLPVILCAHKTREFKIKHEFKKVDHNFKHLSYKVNLDSPLMKTYFHAFTG